MSFLWFIVGLIVGVIVTSVYLFFSADEES